MSVPSISLVVLTYRPGGLDMLAGSLADQTAPFELALVDDLPGRVERGEAGRFLTGKGINLVYHGRSKPPSRPLNRYGIANAMNTGALHCSGDVVVFLHDYAWLPPRAVESWQEAFSKRGLRTLISGAGVIKDGAPVPCGDDVATWPGEGWPGCLSNVPGKTENWTPRRFEVFYCGIPTRFLDEVNGVDERADRFHTFPLTSLERQAELNGYALAVEPSIKCNFVDHRRWGPGWHVTQAEGKVRPEEPEWERRSPNNWWFYETRLACRPRQTEFSRPASSVSEVWSDGLILYVPRDNGDLPSLTAGRYETDLVRRVQEFVRQGDVTADVGAGVGYYSFRLSRQVGTDGKVYAVEPSAENVDSIRRGIVRNRCDNIEVIEAAAGEGEGVTDLYLCEDSRLHSVFDRSDGRRSRLSNVRLKTLDSIVTGQLQFLKIDAEGSEVGCLRGSARCLSGPGRCAVLLEVWPEGCRRNKYDPFESIEILLRYGFTVQEVPPRSGGLEALREFCRKAGSDAITHVWAERAAERNNQITTGGDE